MTCLGGSPGPLELKAASGSLAQKLALAQHILSGYGDVEPSSEPLSSRFVSTLLGSWALLSVVEGLMLHKSLLVMHSASSGDDLFGLSFQRSCNTSTECSMLARLLRQLA